MRLRRDWHVGCTCTPANLAAYAGHLLAVGDEVSPVDLVLRLAEQVPVDGTERVNGAGTLASAEDTAPLGGRIPVDRTTFGSQLAALSDIDRRLLQLVEIEGRSHADAAAALGLPSAAASCKRYSRACHFVRVGVCAT